MQNSRIFLNSRAKGCSLVKNQNINKGYRSDKFQDARAVGCTRPAWLQRPVEQSALIIAAIQKAGRLVVSTAKKLDVPAAASLDSDHPHSLKGGCNANR